MKRTQPYANSDETLRRMFADVSTRDLMARGPDFPDDVWAEICRRAKPGMMVKVRHAQPETVTKRRDKNG